MPEYEYRDMPHLRYGGLQELDRLGGEGWELVAEPERQPKLRRPQAEPAGNWEYHVFERRDLPSPAWENHLASCGWTLVAHETGYPDYSSEYIGKRPGGWRGADDGDVLARLSDLGAEPSRIAQERGGVVARILELKWLRSSERGHDIGTYEAVRQWLAHEYVPARLQEFGRTPPPRAPEDFLDELLGLRARLAAQRWGVALRDAVEVWCRDNGP